ncbi:leucine rich repeat containing 48 [Nesidiocoris tenuis]|uniref:Dynein axonemal assembly factor 1 homolog n=1 Tax=Nesidiocoris tenuis TaxID=355587 RepID=A0ABN7AME2_9HEMI|nr:leucine rich repeat containing 48 [Nesidiocoris tenuis]
MVQENTPWDFPEDTVALIDKEPGVINNAMILDAYCELVGCPLDSNKELDKIKELQLEFYDILRIDHLNMCTQLTKLSLSNNVIKEIGNLHKLINLVSLNLSFNRISKIKGLETLVNLEELSLFGNRITVVENLDSQTDSLRLLSLGGNRIESSKCMIYLRKFKKLSSLNLEGNPFVVKCDYSIAEVVGGLIPNVDYYDYRMIKPEMRERGKDKIRSLLDELAKIEANEALMRKMDDFTSKIASYQEKAFISGFGDDEFYDRMLSRDVEGQNLIGISDSIKQVFKRLKDGLCRSSKNIVKLGVAFYNERKNEVGKYKEGYSENMMAVTHQSTVVIRDFMTSKTQFLKKLLDLYKAEDLDEAALVMRLKRAIIFDKDFTYSRRKTWWDLMEQEMLKHDKNEKNLVCFEDKLQDLGKAFLEKIQVEFANMRDMEEEFYVALADQVNRYLVQVYLNTDSSQEKDRISGLLNKDKRCKIINQSHKNHLSEIEMEEEKLMGQVKDWQDVLIKKFFTAEIERNRKAIIEINRFITYHKNDWAFQTKKALSHAYAYMKSVDPDWTHEIVRIKMNSKERMMDDQMEAMFRERFKAVAMRKRIEDQVKEEAGQPIDGPTDFKIEEKRELEVRARRRAVRFAYATLFKRNSQLELIYQLWNSAEDLPTLTEDQATENI